jgi:hypothetical protein
MIKAAIIFACMILVSCEIPVEPVTVTVEVQMDEIDYIDLNWIARGGWSSTNNCLGGVVMYIQGGNPTLCDPSISSKKGVLRLHSIQFDNGIAWAVLDYSEIDHPETIHSYRIELERWTYEER